MRPAPLRPAAAAVATTAQPQRYLTNDEAAEYLRLIEQRLGRQLAATVRGGSVSWELGRQRCPSVG